MQALLSCIYCFHFILCVKGFTHNLQLNMSAPPTCSPLSLSQTHTHTLTHTNTHYHTHTHFFGDIRPMAGRRQAIVVEWTDRLTAIRLSLKMFRLFYQRQVD
jgi:hypothetical protein